MKKLFNRLLLSLFVLCGMLVAAELLLRLLYPQEVAVLRPDSHIGWRLRSNVDGVWRREVSYDCGYSRFRTTDIGLRDSLLRTNATRTIWVAGDSFIQAANVNDADTACAVLEDRLCVSGIVEVVNLGVQGYGPIHSYHYLDLLLREGVVPAPDQIIYCFFVGNDFLDSYTRFSPRSKRTAVIEGGEVVELPPQPSSWKRSTILWLGVRSHLIRLVKRSLLSREGMVDDTLKRWGLLASNLEASNISPEDRDMMVRLAHHYLNRLKDLADRAGAAFSVVWIEVHESSSQREDMELMNRALRAELDAQGIQHVSFAAMAGDGKTFLWTRGSGHFTPEGNTAFAEILHSLVR